MSDCFTLAEWGGPRFASMFALAAATRMRSALTTCSTWQARLERLRQVLTDMGCATLWNATAMAPPFWRSPPFARFLEQAAFGFVQDRHLGSGGTMARALWDGKLGRGDSTALFRLADCAAAR
eukprot:1858845-Pyramimonas_sp.AAC.1